MSEREVGFYWVRVRGGGPEVAHYTLDYRDRRAWLLVGTDDTSPDESDVEVLGERLLPPPIKSEE